jgi:hypothetical protein
VLSLTVGYCSGPAALKRKAQTPDHSLSLRE